MPRSCSCGLHIHVPALRCQEVGKPPADDAPTRLRCELTAEILAEMQATRREIHANPELSFHEKETAALVAARLRVLPGFDVTEGIAPGHGVVALLR